MPPALLIDSQGRNLSLHKIDPPARPEIARGAFNQTSRRNQMQKRFIGWMTLGSAFAFGLALSLSLIAAPSAMAKSAKSGDEVSADSTAGMSKEDQAKLKEHNKLRSEIVKQKYPASKADVVAHVKGIKADDKKWFEETLPERTYGSADEVMSALGWETAASADNGEKPAAAHSKSSKASSSTKHTMPAQ
jgi:hypothetical protein